jgi:hypothetical protein
MSNIRRLGLRPNANPPDIKMKAPMMAVGISQARYFARNMSAEERGEDCNIQRVLPSKEIEGKTNREQIERVMSELNTKQRSTVITSQA